MTNSTLTQDPQNVDSQAGDNIVPGDISAFADASDLPATDVRGVLAIKPFRDLWISLGLSSMGDWLGLLAITAMASNLGGEKGYQQANLAVAAVLFLRMAPALLLGPIAGVVADRFNRRTTMVVGDLLRGVLFVSIPLVGSLTWIFIATVFIEIIGLFWSPAKDSTVPNMVPESRLATANQLSLATTYGSAPIAAVLFSALAVIMRFTGDWGGGVNAVALYINAATYFLAAMVIWQLPLPNNMGAIDKNQSVLVDLREGFEVISSTDVRGLVVGMLGAFAAGGTVVGVGAQFAKDLSAGEAGYGMLFGAVFTGLALGMWLGPRLMERSAKWRVFALAIVSAGAFLLLLALITYLTMAVIFAVLLGFGAGVAWVVGYTMVGLTVPDEYRGRAFSFINAGARVVLLAAMSFAPAFAAALGTHEFRLGSELVVDYNGTALTLMFAGIVACVIGSVSYRMMHDGSRMQWIQDVVSFVMKYRDIVPFFDSFGSSATNTGGRHAAPRPPQQDINSSARYTTSTSDTSLLSAMGAPGADGSHRGTFVVFEGGDGAGKSTQLEQLASWLEALGRAVVVTREPGATPAGQKLRELLLHTESWSPRAEALLFAADRAHHVTSVIRPALERGDVVLCDRYIDSSVAYQGAGRELDPVEVAAVSEWATGELVPDLTVLLDVDVQTAKSRRDAAGVHADRLESEADDFHNRVREHFLALAAKSPERYLVLDASLPIGSIHDEVAFRVAEVLGLDPESTPPLGPGEASDSAVPGNETSTEVVDFMSDMSPLAGTENFDTTPSPVESSATAAEYDPLTSPLPGSNPARDVYQDDELLMDPVVGAPTPPVTSAPTAGPASSATTTPPTSLQPTTPETASAEPVEPEESRIEHIDIDLWQTGQIGTAENFIHNKDTSPAEPEHHAESRRDSSSDPSRRRAEVAAAERERRRLRSTRGVDNQFTMNPEERR